MFRKLLFLFLSLFPFISALSGTIPFVTTWETSNTGSSANNQITIPTFLGEVYNYTVDWGDGSAVTVETGDATHTYTNPGQYQVSITGVFPRIYFNGGGDALKLLSIDQWGNNNWSSMSGAFNGCAFMIGRFTDIPDLTSVTSMFEMFRQNQSFNTNINDWDVSNVTNMGGLFQYALNYNQPLNNWDVSNVTNMSDMFNNFIDTTIVITNTPIPGTSFINSLREVTVTGSFDQDLSSWDVSNVESMYAMFAANPFNQDISNWDVGEVKNMSVMFYVATSFNQNINDWDVSSVTDMLLMFGDAGRFNQPLSNWNVASVVTMRGMFNYAVVFNQDISNWDVSKVVDMSGMFSSATNFNQDISGWDVSKVEFMNSMFQNTDFFNQDISNWDVSSVTDMRGMFFGSESFNTNIEVWDVSNVSLFSAMFAYANSYNQPLNGWDVSNALSLDSMFTFASIFNQPLDSWDVSLVEEMDFMFYEAFDFDQDLGTWNVQNLLTAVNMFTGVQLTTENYDSLLIGWESAIINNGVPFSGGLSQYCAGESARERLINISNWSITDEGKVVFEMSAIPDQEVEYRYVLPKILGVNLTGNQAYYSEAGGQGTKYVAGEEFVYSETETYPMSIYVYDETSAKNPCYVEQEFKLTLTKCGNSVAPVITTVTNVMEDHSFEFPKINGTNLSGNEAYYTESDGQGKKYLEGETIYYSPDITYPISLFIYDEKVLTGYRCSNEKTFLLTITEKLPNCTSLISPFNGEENVPVNTTLEWEEIYNATGYWLNVGITANGNEILDTVAVTNNYYEFSEELSSAQELYVTIIPYNSIGDAVNCGYETFRTETNIRLPEFFTPNNDRVNDEWIVPNPFNSFDKAFIYDRYGKLLHQIISPDVRGWNGIFAGKIMPSDSYWYVVSYKSGEVFKGSFALVR